MLSKRITASPDAPGNAASSLSTGEAIAYSLPYAVLSFASLPLVIYLPAFYSETVGLSLASIALCLFAARVFDVISDPLIGVASDTLRSRFGLGRRTLMLVGTPLLCVGLYRLLNPPIPADATYLLSYGILTWSAWSLIAVPYLAWGAETGAASDARNRAPFFRETAGLIGVAASIVLARIAGVDADAAQFLPLASTVFLIALPLCMVLAVTLAPEHPPTATIHTPPPARSDTVTRRHIYQVMVLSGTANAIPACLFLFFVRDVLKLADMTGVFLGLYFIAGVVSLPLWLRFSRRHGKTRAWRDAMLLATLAFACVPAIAAFPVLAMPGFALICLLTGAVQTADLALPASMLADATRTEQTRTGLAFGVWGVLTKLSAALGVLFAFGALALVGYDRNADPDLPGLIMLTAMYSVFPVAIKALAIFNLSKSPPAPILTEDSV